MMQPSNNNFTSLLIITTTTNPMSALLEDAFEPPLAAPAPTGPPPPPIQTFKLRRALGDSGETELVIQTFDDRVLVIVTQNDKVGCLVSVDVGLPGFGAFSFLCFGIFRGTCEVWVVIVVALVYFDGSGFVRVSVALSVVFGLPWSLSSLLTCPHPDHHLPLCPRLH
jgi:hypothetical protein